MEISRSELNGSLDYKLKPDSKKIVQGVFSLKNLSYFIKCTPLCNQIELGWVAMRAPWGSSTSGSTLLEHRTASELGADTDVLW